MKTTISSGFSMIFLPATFEKRRASPLWPYLRLSHRPTAVGVVGAAPRPSGLRRGTTDDETVPPFGPLEHKAGTSRGLWHKEVYFFNIFLSLEND